MLSDDASALKLVPSLLRKVALEIEAGTSIGMVRHAPDTVAFLVKGQGTAARISGARQPVANFTYVLLSEDLAVVEAVAERATRLALTE
jgi:hypothetical protein